MEYGMVFTVLGVITLMIAPDINGKPGIIDEQQLILDIPDEIGHRTHNHRVVIEERFLFGTDTILGFIATLLAEILLSSNKELTCAVLSQKEAIEFALDFVPDSVITSGLKRSIRRHTKKCQNHTLGNAISSHFVLLVKMAKNGGIYPGTKWCGMGNRAEDDELGTAEATDKCCRESDLLENHIPLFGTLDDIENKYPYVISSCDDDKKLYACLLNDSSKASKEFGQFYFDVMKARCYANTYPMKCTKTKLKILSFKRKCVNYTLETEKERKYQLFKPVNFYWEYVTKWNMPAAKRRPVKGVDPPGSWKLIDIYDKDKPPEDKNILKRVSTVKPPLDQANTTRKDELNITETSLMRKCNTTI
ncbi:uncharacterized protein LOC135383857 [Ornithodoros turicata]|uniref:uncharacterized protein LOC135383857 n=1 Tax=Ornithodoros turicata TaxID=34597 RepID=UPI0031391950